MGDYLRSLAIRTLSPPSVRPRARSRFEPAKSPFMGSRDTDLPEIEQRIKLRETPAPRIVTSREPSVEPKNDRVPARTEAPAAPASQRIAAPPAQEQAPAPPPSRPAASGREEVKPLMAGRNPTTTATVRAEIPNRPSEKEPKIIAQ